MSLIALFLDQFGSEHTQRAYRTDLNDFFGSEGQELTRDQVAEVTKANIQAYVRSMKAEEKSTSTLQRRLSALRCFYDWLLEQSIVNQNPARACQVDLSRFSDPTADVGESASVLSKSEVETLISATEDAGDAAARDRGLVLTILYAALRRAEVAAMNVDHVRPLGRHWVIDLPAGDAWSSAYVKVPDVVVEAIDTVESRYNIDQGSLWRSLSNRNRGARMSPDAIYKMVRRTGQTAGLANVTPEVLRQTGLYLALNAGATMQQLQVHARLQSVASVERYADLNEQSSRLGESAADFVDLDV